jgi:hypothetical protein
MLCYCRHNFPVSYNQQLDALDARIREVEAVTVPLHETMRPLRIPLRPLHWGRAASDFLRIHLCAQVEPGQSGLTYHHKTI